MMDRQNLFEARTHGYHIYRIPGMAVTRNQVVLVTTEARPGKGGDYDYNDVLLRRSSDGGQTFGPVMTIVDHVTYGEGPVSNFVMIPDQNTGRVVAVFFHDYARAFTLFSDDDGATWSTPVEITAVFEQFRPEYAWRVCANGCGSGLQLRNGRMIMTVWLSDGSGSEMGPKHRGHRPSVVTSIFSDDGGATWQRGEIVARHGDEVAGVTVVNPSETAAVELSDGTVLFNLRHESLNHRRLLARSPDGAGQWQMLGFDPELLEPVCMASLLRYRWPSGDQPGCLLFANPDTTDKTMVSWAMDRKRLTIKLSEDDGQTWSLARILEPGPAGYSALARLADGTILCFFESGMVSGMCDTRYLCLARFDLDWFRAP
jgi:sialidase-1